MASQPAVLDADQEHSRETLTLIELVPPSGPKVRGVASKLGWHRAAADVGAVTLVDVEPPQPEAMPATANARNKRLTTERKSTTRCGNA